MNKKLNQLAIAEAYLHCSFPDLWVSEACWLPHWDNLEITFVADCCLERQWGRGGEEGDKAIISARDIIF